MPNNDNPNQWPAIAILCVLLILAASCYVSFSSGATLETSFDVVMGMLLITLVVAFARWSWKLSIFACGWILSICSLAATWRVVNSAMVNNPAFEAHWYTSSFAFLTGFGILISALFLRLSR